MNQSAILRASYETVYKNLSKFAGETGLFEMGDGGAVKIGKDGSKAIVCLGVSGVGLLHHDKGGQTVEANEIIFEAPSHVGCILFLTVAAKQYPPLLEAVGALIRHFKDNNFIDMADYKWHGEDEGKVFIEPVVGELGVPKESQFQGMPSVTLHYRMEMWINSQKGAPFKRVTDRTIKGNIIDT